MTRVLIAAMFLSSTALVTTATAQTGTATQFYMSYRAAFDKAQKIEELMPYLIAANRKQIESTPPGERVEMFELLKMVGTMKDVKVLKATKNQRGEMLAVEGLTDGKKQTCDVEIVNEGGAWKVGAEKCKGSF
jgi:hypothetical protein